jgi:hypothetical protein
MTFSTWSQTAASNTSVGGISTDGTVTLVKQIDNMFRGMMAELAVARDDGTIDATAPRGYLHGLTLSNNVSDATNDIDIAIGEAAASASPYWKMTIASALTKHLDAAWAVGTNQGGLDTGSIANTTYHIWLIQRSDTLVVDVLFSTSATAPTMPTNYDRKRRIGSIRRVGATILAFTQNGDKFTYATPVLDIAATNPGAAAVTRSLTVPTGIVVSALLAVSTVNTAALVLFRTYVSALELADLAPDANLNSIAPAANGSGSTQNSAGWIEVVTNTSGQIRTRHSASDANCSLSIELLGWIDTRGRVA